MDYYCTVSNMVGWVSQPLTVLAELKMGANNPNMLDEHQNEYKMSGTLSRRQQEVRVQQRPRARVSRGRGRGRRVTCPWRRRRGRLWHVIIATCKT